MGSMPRKMAWRAPESFSTLQDPILPKSLSESLELTIEPSLCIVPEKNLNCIWIVKTRQIKLIILLQDFHFWIAQVEYWGQTRYTENLGRKTLINTYYHIQRRLELKYFVFAHVLLDSTLLCSTIWSGCAACTCASALQSQSGQIPSSWTGRRSRSASLHRMLIETCRLVPTTYLYSKTKANPKVWANPCALHWSVTHSCHLHWKMHITFYTIRLVQQQNC